MKATGKTQADIDAHYKKYNQITEHAKGGIVTRPLVGLVGEAGPEGIIPLKKGGGGLLGGVTVNAPITINGPVSDSGNLAAILSEHAREIARQVSRRLRSSTNGKRSSERLRRCL